ncbi:MULTISPECIES: hypothetical protein [Actinomyces]|uniref:hypothetical protein n=1 Tax=Actinomyces TaxID=1654 RepID=UPI0015B8647A|nr:hypothetical protein [Actinomyces oris]
MANPCSAVVSTSISILLTDFAWHSGLFAAATAWVAHRFFTTGLPIWVFAVLRV